MKKILITGKDSYIGLSVEKWLLKESENFQITTLDMKNSYWKKHDFSKYDVIFHVAGIAHSDAGKADEKTKDLYYKVNTELTIEVAMKAKKCGVKQFIFMSSMIVYGDSSTIGQKKIIDKNTIPKPANFYGESKLQAEKGIEILNDENFKVVIIRPPMIYGKDSKGNYVKLSKLAKFSPIFPDIQNERSMLHIDNLCEFIKSLIDENDQGTFFPQNREYVNTSLLVLEISKACNKGIKLTGIFNPLIFLFSKKKNIINKIFGNLVYDKEMSLYKTNYQLRNFEETVRLTEG